MGLYNILTTTLTCPHCGTAAESQVDLYFGDTRNLTPYAVGDLYAWIPDAGIEKGGRPADGNLDGEGYAECLNCRRDFFVVVSVREDRITGAQPDRSKKGYVGEGESSVPVSPPSTPDPASWKKWKPIPYDGKPGKITYNPLWKLTPKIKEILEKLSAAGVDVYSSRDSSDYTMLVPHGITREEYQAIEQLMAALSKALRTELYHVDFYPHGNKFRISPSKG